jgi:hypothetical protein
MYHVYTWSNVFIFVQWAVFDKSGEKLQASKVPTGIVSMQF